jgi:hypothetical protein
MRCIAGGGIAPSRAKRSTHFGHLGHLGHLSLRAGAAELLPMAQPANGSSWNGFR